MNWDYITGFFDADGSITASNNNKGKNRTLVLSFHNTEINILTEIKDFISRDIGVKGTISKHVHNKEGETHYKNSLTLVYTYRNAVKVANKLNSIHPKKKYRIEIYNLIQAKTKRNGKYTEEELIERSSLVDKFFQIK